MKIARMEFRSVGLFRALEIHGLSPGLNVVFGPTGSGKTTIRKAIGGMFYGFDRSEPNALIDNNGLNSSGQLEVELQGAKYSLNREDNLWSSSADLIRRSSSGVARISTSSALGGLSSFDYFTFFNASLIDSPDLHRRMVQALKGTFGQSSTGGFWKTKSEYLAWRKLAEQRREDLSELERQLIDLRNSRDRLSNQLHSNKESFQIRLKDLEDRIASLSSQIVDLKHRRTLLQDERNQIEAQVERLRYQIRNAPTETVTKKPVEVSDRLVELYKMLDEVQTRIARIRTVQKDLSERRMELREARTESTDEPNRIAELELKTVRAAIVQLEDRIEDLHHALKEAAIIDHHDQHLEQTTRQSLVQAKEDLYVLCQDLSQHQRHLARGRMNAESRDLKRCWNELKRQLAWLKIHRKSVLEEIRILDYSGYQLIVRGRRPFCNCARHHGHLEARRRFLEEQTIVHPGVDTSDWEAELQILLEKSTQLNDRILDLDHQIASKDSLLQDSISQKNALLSELDHHLEQRIRDLVLKIEDLEDRIAKLRILVDKDRPLWDLKFDDLLDRASEILERISTGKIVSLQLNTNEEKIVVRDQHGSLLKFEELGRSDQDQICLALCLAVASRMATAGHYIPMVFDDLFVNLDDSRSKATRKELRRFVDAGHQIIIFAAHRQLHDRYISYSPERLAGDLIAVFELPNLSVDLENIRWPIILHPGAKPVVPTKPVVKVAEPEFSGVIDENTLLSVIDLVDPEFIPTLTDHHVLTVGDLLDLDPSNLDVSFENRGINPELMQRWQHQGWLICCVPGLRVYDSRLLVGSGITEPEILESLSSHEVLERLERFLSTQKGQRVMRSGSEYELSRVNRWMKSLKNNDSSWRSRSRRSRRRDRSEFRTRSSRNGSTTAGVSDTTVVTDSLLKKVFYLNLADDVEKAPSIGNRMSERLAAVDVSIVSQLLDSDPTILSGRLDDRRITPETITAWQHQAKLVCQIPNLRGHDAQLLVACDFLTLNRLRLLIQPIFLRRSCHSQNRKKDKKSFDPARNRIWTKLMTGSFGPRTVAH